MTSCLGDGMKSWGNEGIGQSAKDLSSIILHFCLGKNNYKTNPPTAKDSHQHVLARAPYSQVSVDSIFKVVPCLVLSPGLREWGGAM